MGAGLSDDAVVDDDIRLAVISGSESVLDKELTVEVTRRWLMPSFRSRRCVERSGRKGNSPRCGAEAANCRRGGRQGDGGIAVEEVVAPARTEMPRWAADPGATSFALLMRTIADQLG